LEANRNTRAAADSSRIGVHTKEVVVRDVFRQRNL